jgi:cytochrome c-type biogenesis protein CcmH/NrfG
MIRCHIADGETLRGVESTSPSTRPAAGQTRGRRRPRFSRSQVVFSVLGLLVICSLLAGTLGAAVFDRLDETDGNEDVSTSGESTALEQSLREMIASDPNDAASMATLANLLANGGELDEAILWYDKALALIPNDTTVRLDFARSLADGDKLLDAEVQFRKVLELEPDHVDAHFYLAELYQNWQPPRTDEAVAEYRRAIELRPDSFLAQRAREELISLGAATPVTIGTPT